MKRIDYFLGLSFISFILCIGLMDVQITSLNGYFYFLGNEGNLLLYLSVPCLIIFMICLVKEILCFIKKK